MKKYGVQEKEKPKVLIVHNYYQIPGGEDVVVTNEKRMLEKFGHEVILYTRDNSELKNFTKLQKIKLPITTVFNKKTYDEVKKIIQDQHVEIVHVHNTLSLVSPSVYYAAISCKVPVVQTVHNFRLLCVGAAFYRDGHICELCVRKGIYCAVKYNCYRKSKFQTLGCVINTIFHRLTGIYKKLNYICLTDFNKEKLLLFNQIIPQNVFVKPNFVEKSETFIPTEKRKNRFIFVGRIDKLKGVDILLYAWKLMKSISPELVICGTGPLEEWCKKYVEDNELSSVRIEGFVPNEKVKKLIAGSKALIFPSQWYEGFPMSIVEAFTVGTPVIASDMGNMGSLVIEGVNGYKFKSDSPENLMETVSGFTMNHDICRSTMIEYEEHYTELKNYKYMLDIYMKIRKNCCC